MSYEAIQSDVLVVGAGLAGLLAAHTLQAQGLQVLVVDKGSGVGGRLATRRLGPGRADHGAQFFTVRSPEFQVWFDQWLAEGLVYQWSSGWTDGSLSASPPDGYPRYAVSAGMNSLAKRLAAGLNIQVKVRLTAVELNAAKNGWLAWSEEGRRYTSQALLLTPPAPQSLALLAAGKAPLALDDRAALEQIEYAPCVCGLFWVEGEVHLPESGAIQRPHAPISWLADNQRKGISPEAKIITIHAGPQYSLELWDVPEKEVLAALQSSLQPFLDPAAKIVEAQLKRWRYALPTCLYPERYLRAANLPPLVFAGDAFGGPRVEGAALSGLAAGQILAAS